MATDISVTGLKRVTDTVNLTPAIRKVGQKDIDSAITTSSTVRAVMSVTIESAIELLSDVTKLGKSILSRAIGLVSNLVPHQVGQTVHIDSTIVLSSSLTLGKARLIESELTLSSTVTALVIREEIGTLMPSSVYSTSATLPAAIHSEGTLVRTW
jgi:hypothetical protein